MIGRSLWRAWLWLVDVLNGNSSTIPSNAVLFILGALWLDARAVARAELARLESRRTEHPSKESAVTDVSQSNLPAPLRMPGLRGKAPARAPEERIAMSYAHEYAVPGSSFAKLLAQALDAGDVTAGITDWGMLGNGPDPTLTPPRRPIGDCIWAGRQHNRMAKAAAAGMLATETWETSDELVDECVAQGGENGANIPDQLLEWLDAGIILGFAPLPLDDRNVQNAALLTFHGEYVGVDLTDDADPRFAQRVPWSIADGQQPDPMDGHCVVRAKFDQENDWYLTWGGVQQASIGWTAACVTERYVLVTTEDEAANMNMPAILADIAAWRGQVAPSIAPPAPAPEPAPVDPAPVIEPVVTPPAPVDPEPPVETGVEKLRRLIARAEEELEAAAQGGAIDLVKARMSVVYGFHELIGLIAANLEHLP